MGAARKRIEPVEDRWLSMPKAAAELRCTRYLVSQFIARGLLRSDLAAGRTVVDREDVALLKAQREAERASHTEVVAAT